MTRGRAWIPACAGMTRLWTGIVSGLTIEEFPLTSHSGEQAGTQSIRKEPILNILYY